MIQSSEKCFLIISCFLITNIEFLTSKEGLLKELELISTQFGWHSAIFILSATPAWNQSQPKKTDYLCADFKRHLPRRLCAERRWPTGRRSLFLLWTAPFGRRKFILFCDGHSRREEYASIPSLFGRVSFCDFQAKHWYFKRHSGLSHRKITLNF